MTNPEYYKQALDAIDSHVHRYVKELLDSTNGNIELAMKIWTTKKNYWDDSIAERMGGFGMFGPNCIGVRCNGSAASHNILCWNPGSRIIQPHDFEIEWKEVFSYIKTGKVEKAFQMSLF